MPNLSKLVAFALFATTSCAQTPSVINPQADIGQCPPDTVQKSVPSSASKGSSHFCRQKNGKKHGPFLQYHPWTMESVHITGQFDEQGRRDGPWRWHYKSGQLAREASYVGGKLEGKEVSFRPDGQRFAQATWKSDVLEGPACVYHDTGVANRCGEFVAGEFSGVWQWKSRDGKSTFEEKFSKDSMVRILVGQDDDTESQKEPVLVEEIQMIDEDTSRVTYTDRGKNEVVRVNTVVSAPGAEYVYVAKRDVSHPKKEYEDYIELKDGNKIKASFSEESEVCDMNEVCTEESGRVRTSPCPRYKLKNIIYYWNQAFSSCSPNFEQSFLSYYVRLRFVLSSKNSAELLETRLSAHDDVFERCLSDKLKEEIGESPGYGREAETKGLCIIGLQRTWLPAGTNTESPFNGHMDKRPLFH